MTITLIIAAVLSMVVLVLFWVRWRDSQEIENIWQSLESNATTEYFRTEMVADMPEAARRYFLHAIAPGTPLASWVHLTMRGSFGNGEKEKWMPMEAEEIINAQKGFVWKAAVGKKFFPAVGADYYTQGVGKIAFSLWGIVPCLHAKSPDVSRSALGRWVAELIWLPSAWLCQNKIDWYEIDNNNFVASLTVDNEIANLTFTVDDKGKLQKISLYRWGNQTAGKIYQYLPFGGECEEESTFSGLTIPTKVNVGWGFGTDNYSEFFRAKVDQAIFC